MPKRSKSSAGWLSEHVHDDYVKRAQKEGYRARSAYKLLEIQAKDHLIEPGGRVVDLGSAPGSWSQVASELVGVHGRVIALDILPMQAIERVEFIQGDFTENAVLDTLVNTLSDSLIDLVICDIAPNMSGQAVTDQAKSYYLCELALDFALGYLKEGGGFLVKVFQGAGFDDYMAQMRRHFTKVLVRKPEASRDRSREVYLLGKDLKKQQAPEQGDGEFHEGV